MNVQQLYNQALGLHQNGRLADAERLCLQILPILPRNFAVRHLLGVIRAQQGRNAEALEFIGAALKLNPNAADALMNYANILKALGRFDESLENYDKALAIKPQFAEALANRGSVLLNLNRHHEALKCFDRALAIKPGDVLLLNNRGVTLWSLKRFGESLETYDRALAVSPHNHEVLYNRGVALNDMHRFSDALESFNKALAIRPLYVEALYNRAIALRSLNRFENALESFDEALKLNPQYAEALCNRGSILCELKRFEEALATFDCALVVRPNYAEALNNRGNALWGLKRADEALMNYEKALEIQPDFVEAMTNRGNALRYLRRFEEALASYNQALAIRPDFAEVLNNSGAVLQDLRRLPEALARFEAAIAIKPDNSEALFNRGINLREQGHLAEALASFDAALAAEPHYAEAFYQRGYTLQCMDRTAEALESFEKALAYNPDHLHALGGIASSALHLCDWARADNLTGMICSRAHRAIIPPLTVLGYSDDASIQYEYATRYMRDKIGILPQPLWDANPYHHCKIRVAYLSSDFREHPVGFQIAELLERHDRSLFEVIGISIGPNDHSEMRARIIKSVDQFHDGWLSSDLGVAELLRELEADLVVDLNGHTSGFRPEILSHRPAPVQVNYLGYPGTMGCDFIDYVIADGVVLPFEQQPFFREKIVHLPDSFWASDSAKITGTPPTRANAGLPDTGFVFCCFNSHWKITAPIFDLWMRLLNKLPKSVLWLKQPNESVTKTLRLAAAARGISPDRLIFAERTATLDEHLARHQLADLALDTLPYNAHATAKDALSAGVPLLTCKGHAFAARVGASMLGALGMAELVTQNLIEYEGLALNLAHDQALLASLKLKLARNRETHALFNAERFRRNIEAAYIRMWEIAKQGHGPKNFAVGPA